jgi:hypothetical protein
MELENTVKYLGKQLIENKKCSVCYEFILTGQIFLPCNHYHICNFCYSNLDNRICPICRTSIKNIIKLNITNNKKQRFNSWWPEKLI